MGNGTSMEASKVIFVEVNGKHEKIVFSRHCSSRDISELLCQTAGVNRFSQITLKDKEGGLVTISPTMPCNMPSAPYSVEFKEVKQDRENNGVIPGGDSEVISQVLTQVAEQFNKTVSKAFKVDDLKSDINNRLTLLEKRMEIEGMKIIEIEMCKKDISEIKNQIYDAQKKMGDYSKHGNDRRIGLKGEIPSYPKYTLSQETIDYLRHPTFDIWHWEPNEMLSLLEHMYHELGVVSEFNMNPITLKRWLLCVQENYRNNPFHNFRHCFCVTQMMYGLIHQCGLTKIITREDLGIMLTACVCHDLDHPGYNNTYQINARTDLAIRYNDISPLENHHCAVAFQILSSPETNIFGNCDSTQFKRIRSGMIMLILATDMARHSEILEAFKSKLDGFDFTKEDHLNSLKMVLIKCCDISNEVRPMTVSEPWVDCLLEEYFNQSDREKQEGLPVAPFMDRDKVTKPTAQIGFIKFVLIPMFETVAKLFVQLDDVMVKPLKAARDKYEEMKEHEDKVKKQQQAILEANKPDPKEADKK